VLKKRGVKKPYLALKKKPEIVFNGTCTPVAPRGGCKFARSSHNEQRRYSFLSFLSAYECKFV